MARSGFFVPEPGDVVADKYIIERHLAKGAMGLVAEARHRKLDQRVALKFMLPRELNQPDAVRRFAREARAVSRLKSPYTVRILDVDETTDGLPFIVMEYLEGRDLGSELKERSVLPVPEAVDLILQACAALAEAHARGVIHRDLKPANLFLARMDDGTIALKVTDFGIAKFIASDDSDLTSTGAILGTPHYIAPEQLLNTGKEKIDHRSDVWALGVVLYRMLSGRLPISGETPAAIAIAVATTPPVPLATVAPHLPAALCDAVMKAVSRSLSKRWPDVASLARAIEPFGTGKLSFAALAPAIGTSSAVAATTPPAAEDSEPTSRVPMDAPLPDSSPTLDATLTERMPRAAPTRGWRSAVVVVGVAALVLTATLLVRYVWPARLSETDSDPIERSFTAPVVGLRHVGSSLDPAETPPPRASERATATPSAAPARPTAPGASTRAPTPTGSARSPAPATSVEDDPLHL